MFILQQNAQRSELAQLEIVRKLAKFASNTEYVALIQEPYKNNFYTDSLALKPPGSLVFPSTIRDGGPRTAIFASPGLRLKEIPELSCSDCTVCCSTVNGRMFIFASIYLDILKEVKQEFLIRLMEYVDNKGAEIILSMDSNCHSTLFGPTQNARGDELDEFIFANGLVVQNRCQTPTYRRINAATYIDVTLSKNCQAIQDWEVDSAFNHSDHSTITCKLNKDTPVAEKKENGTH